MDKPIYQPPATRNGESKLKKKLYSDTEDNEQNQQPVSEPASKGRGQGREGGVESSRAERPERGDKQGQDKERRKVEPHKEKGPNIGRGGRQDKGRGSDEGATRVDEGKSNGEVREQEVREGTESSVARGGRGGRGRGRGGRGGHVQGRRDSQDRDKGKGATEWQVKGSKGTTVSDDKQVGGDTVNVVSKPETEQQKPQEKTIPTHTDTKAQVTTKPNAKTKVSNQAANNQIRGRGAAGFQREETGNASKKNFTEKPKKWREVGSTPAPQQALKPKPEKKIPEKRWEQKTKNTEQPNTDENPIVLLLKIEVDSGNVDIIEGRLHDRPVDLAEQFSLKHNLSQDILPQLAEFVEQNLTAAKEEHYESLRAQTNTTTENTAEPEPEQEAEPEQEQEAGVETKLEPEQEPTEGIETKEVKAEVEAESEPDKSEREATEPPALAEELPEDHKQGE